MLINSLLSAVHRHLWGPHSWDLHQRKSVNSTRLNLACNSTSVCHRYSSVCTTQKYIPSLIIIYLKDNLPHVDEMNTIYATIFHIYHVCWCGSNSQHIGPQALYEMKNYIMKDYIYFSFFFTITKGGGF